MDNMYLDENPGLSGTLPRELSKMTNMEYFEIYGCSFTGAVPFINASFEDW
jgi:hypothetical protein